MLDRARHALRRTVRTLPEHEGFGAHPLDFSPVPLVIFQMLSDGTLTPLNADAILGLATPKAWQEMAQYFNTGKMELRGDSLDWKEVRVSLCVKDEINTSRLFFYFFIFVLINKACFGARRLPTERDGGGKTQ